jgi:MFS family permease
VICGSTVLVMAGQGVVSPILPLFARDFGVSAAMVGLTFTAFGLARLLLNIPAGIWADRRGRRFLLVGGPLVTSIGMIGSGLAPSIWVLLVWRLVAGAGSALYMTGAQIYLVDIADPTQRARYIATNQGALLVGISSGPAIGGLLAEGFGLRAPFLVVGAAAVLTSVYGWYRLPETRDQVAAVAASMDRVDRSVRRAFFRSRPFIAIGLVTASIFSIRGSRQTLVPLYGADEFGLGAGQIGLIFTGLGVVGLVLIAPAGWSADRFGRKPLIVPTGYLAAVGAVAAAYAPTAGLFVSGLLFSAIGTGIAGPAPAAFVADIAPRQLRGSAMGTYRTWGDLGIVLSPPLSGALADVTSIPAALAANGVFLALTCTWFLVAAPEPARPIVEG